MVLFYGILKYSTLLYCFLVYYYLYSDVMVGMALCKQQPRPETSTNPCFLHKSRVIGQSPSMSLLLFHLFLAMFANLQSDHFRCPALALLVQVYLAGACNWWIMATAFLILQTKSWRCWYKRNIVFMHVIRENFKHLKDP